MGSPRPWDDSAGTLRPRMRRLIALHNPAYRAHANPYTRLLCDGLKANDVEPRDFEIKRCVGAHADIVHFHWPENLLRHRRWSVALANSSRALVFARLCLRRGGKIFWTAHNLGSHERWHPNLERWFWGRWTSMIDGVCALSQGGLDQVTAKYPGLRRKVLAVTPHGHYRSVLSGQIDKQGARAELGVGANDGLIVSAGAVRAYKNLPSLIRVFGEMPPGSRLIVAGSASPAELAREVEAAAQDVPGAVATLRFLDDREMEAHLMASDLAVYAYRDILNSGSALYALSCDRPVLVPNMGAMPELQEMVGSDWVRTFEGELSAQVLADALDWARHERRSARAPLEALDWTRIGLLTRQAYDAALGT